MDLRLGETKTLRRPEINQELHLQRLRETEEWGSDEGSWIGL